MSSGRDEGAVTLGMVENFRFPPDCAEERAQHRQVRRGWRHEVQKYIPVDPLLQSDPDFNGEAGVRFQQVGTQIRSEGRPD